MKGKQRLRSSMMRCMFRGRGAKERSIAEQQPAKTSQRYTDIRFGSAQQKRKMANLTVILKSVSAVLREPSFEEGPFTPGASAGAGDGQNKL